MDFCNFQAPEELQILDGYQIYELQFKI
jgi:hypothetical protein